MNFRIPSNGKLIAAMSALALGAIAAPAYAHWGPNSAFAGLNQTKYCDHKVSGNSSVTRRASIKVKRYVQDLGCEPNPFGPCVDLGELQWDDAIARNVTESKKAADILIAGNDDTQGVGSWALFAIHQNVPYNKDRYLSSTAPAFLWNLREYCAVSDNM